MFVHSKTSETFSAGGGRAVMLMGHHMRKGIPFGLSIWTG